MSLRPYNEIRNNNKEDRDDNDDGQVMNTEEGYGHHESKKQSHRLLVSPGLVGKITSDFLTKGIHHGVLTPIVCACFFRNHLFKHMMMSRFRNPRDYTFHVAVFNWVCHLQPIMKSQKTVLPALVRMNDLTFADFSALTERDWKVVKKRITLSSEDLESLWLCGDNGDEKNITPLLSVFQSVKCRKMVQKGLNKENITSYFKAMTNDYKIRKMFMIALDCWVNQSNGMDNVIPRDVRLSSLSHGEMVKCLQSIFQSGKGNFTFNMTRPLAFNSAKYTPRENETLNRWLSIPHNTSPSMPLLMAIIQCVTDGVWSDFYNVKG